MLILLASAVSFLVTFFSVPVLIRKFSAAGMTGRDVHKAGKPEIPEMGGLAVVAGFVAGILLAIAVSTLSSHGYVSGIESLGSLVEILAAMGTMLVITIIGMFDDLVSMRQSVKALLPVFASLPLVAVAAGNPYITLPLLGRLYLPVLYPLVFIPLGVAVVSNLTNMFAGFNGMEAGLGALMSLGLMPVAYHNGSMTALLILAGIAASSLAFLFYNRFPARIFMGDVGTLFIGAGIASAAIVGNFEFAAVIVMAPHLADFFIKARNRFPSSGWWGTLKGGKLYCEKRPVGLAQHFMKAAGGISERRLVMVFMLLEALFVVLAQAFYLL